MCVLLWTNLRVLLISSCCKKVLNRVNGILSIRVELNLRIFGNNTSVHLHGCSQTLRTSYTQCGSPFVSLVLTKVCHHVPSTKFVATWFAGRTLYNAKWYSGIIDSSFGFAITALGVAPVLENVGKWLFILISDNWPPHTAHNGSHCDGWWLREKAIEPDKSAVRACTETSPPLAKTPHLHSVRRMGRFFGPLLLDWGPLFCITNQFWTKFRVQSVWKSPIGGDLWFFVSFDSMPTSSSQPLHRI